MAEITIATSIVPRNFELQRAAIDSWLHLGFRVFSLNPPEEAAVIRQKFPDIPVKIAKRSAESITGKQYVFLDDIFSALLEERSAICGIVNSDIHLNTKGDFQEFIGRNAASSLIFGARIEVESLDNLIGQEYFGGFDFFFLDRALISLYPKTDFCLGAPWWDFWTPLVPLIRGANAKQLISPFAYHLHHPTKWSQNLFELFGQRFAEYLLQAELNNTLERPLRTAAENSLKKREDIEPLGFFTLYYLKLTSEKISYLPNAESEKKVELTAREYSSLKDNLAFYQMQFLQMFNLLKEREDTSVERLKNLREMHNSLSWRSTATLRWIADRLRLGGERQ